MKLLALPALCIVGLWLSAACAVVPSSARPVEPNHVPEYFAGRTITLVVNFSAGGPTDVFARLIARHLGNHVPGNPTVIVHNVPGAGGKIGANQLYATAKNDGLTIGVFTSPFANQIFDGEGVQYDSTRFVWLGGVAEGDVTFVNSSLGINRPEDLLAAPTEIVVGGFSPDSGVDMSERTILDLWGVHYRYVSGYAGNAEARNAILRNEINLFQVSLTDWLRSVAPLVADGSMIPIGQSGVLRQGRVVRDMRVPDIPTYEEIAVSLKGAAVENAVAYRASVALLEIQGALLRAVVLPAGTESPIVDTLRQALAETVADEDFKVEARRSLGLEISFVPGAEAQMLAADIIGSTGSDALDYLKAMAKRGVAPGPVALAD